jgi:hypothetical protein
MFWLGPSAQLPYRTLQQLLHMFWGHLHTKLDALKQELLVGN